MKHIKILKKRYSHLTNINFDDFKNINGVCYYKVICTECGVDRGYQKPRHALRLCNECRKRQQILAKIKFSNININDFIIKLMGSNKKPQRFYRASCHECGKDRGYIEVKLFNKKCLSCTKTKHRKDLSNVDYSNCIKEKNQTPKYKMSCPVCGKDKGYMPIVSATLGCNNCINSSSHLTENKAREVFESYFNKKFPTVRPDFLKIPKLTLI